MLFLFVCFSFQFRFITVHMFLCYHVTATFLFVKVLLPLPESNFKRDSPIFKFNKLCLWPTFKSFYLKCWLTDYGGFQVDEDSSWHVFASTSLTEEGVEWIITASNGLVTGHLTIRLDTVFQTVQFPAGITDLDSGLSDVDRDTLTLEEGKKQMSKQSENQFKTKI